MARLTDMIFFLYFLLHIPITFFIDFQAVLPQRWYAKQIVDFKNYYCREFRDPMMVEPPTWFHAFLLCEMFLQFPLFFFATYAYYKGAAEARWIRIPVIVYASHVMTTVLTCYHHIMLHDFSDSKHPGPRNLEERLKIVVVYSPFLLLPLWVLLDASFSSVYWEPVKPKVKQR